MTGFLKIEQALINSVVDLKLPYPTEYPNMTVKNKDKGKEWIKVSILNAESNVATLGDTGTDNNPGVLQIDVNVPSGTGGADQLTILDLIATKYPPGRGLQFGGVTAKITRVSVSPLRNVGGYARRTLSINYYARTARR